MSARPNPDHAITQWLRDEADGGAPDRLIAAVRTQLESTDQRRAWWPARRFQTMNATARLLTAAAAVVAVAVIGILALPRASSGPASTPGPSAIATPSPGPSASPSAISQAVEGTLAAGTYSTKPFFNPIPSLRVTFDVPSGYTFVPNWAIIPDSGAAGPQGAGIGFLQPNGLFSDPCHWDLDKDGVIEAGDVPTGSTVDDLVTALRAQTAYGVTVVGDTSLGGFSGKRVDLQLPAPLDLAKCDKPSGAIDAPAFVWGPADLGAADLYIQGSGNRWQVYVLDVNGNRVVVVLQDFATTPASRQTEMKAILDSIRFEP